MSAETTVEEKSLIRQTPQEKTLKKLECLKARNFNNRVFGDRVHSAHLWINRYEASFVTRFIGLCWYTLGVTRKQLGELTKEELQDAADIIAKKVKSRGTWQKIAVTTSWFIPVAGWIFAGTTYPRYNNDNGFLSWGYLRDHKVLKKTFGKDYFPYEELMKELNKEGQK